MAQVRAYRVEDEQKGVGAEQRHQFRTVSKKEDETSCRNRLYNNCPKSEDHAFDRMRAVNSKGCQGLCRMMHFVKTPQDRNPVKCQVHKILSSVIDQKK